MTLATSNHATLVIPFTKRFGKRNTALMGCLLAVVGSLVLPIDPDALGFVIAAQIIRGSGKAAVFGVIFGNARRHHGIRRMEDWFAHALAG